MRTDTNETSIDQRMELSKMKRRLSHCIAALSVGVLGTGCGQSDTRVEEYQAAPQATPGRATADDTLADDMTPEDTTADDTADDTSADDMQESSGPEADPDPVVAAPMALRSFVTAGTFHGDLEQQGGGSDGSDGADRLCASAANAASLGGNWIAWVSTSSVDALARLRNGARWTLIDGVTEVFPSKAAIQLGPRQAIDVTEAGDSLLSSGAAPERVWTNTDRFGRNSTQGQNDACNDWSDQAGIAAVGVLFDPALGAGLGLSWTDTRQPQGCGAEYHLYCFEN